MSNITSTSANHNASLLELQPTRYDLMSTQISSLVDDSMCFKSLWSDTSNLLKPRDDTLQALATWKEVSDLNDSAELVDEARTIFDERLKAYNNVLLKEAKHERSTAFAKTTISGIRSHLAYCSIPADETEYHSTLHDCHKTSELRDSKMRNELLESQNAELERQLHLYHAALVRLPASDRERFGEKVSRLLEAGPAVHAQISAEGGNTIPE